MTLFFNVLRESFMGYAGVLACISLGLLFLRQADKGEPGPGFWSLGFLLNSLGFMLWSGAIPIPRLLYQLIGEVFHIFGFLSIVWGAYRFSGNKLKKWNVCFISFWFLMWVASVLLIARNASLANAFLKGLRAILFICAGVLILTNTRKFAPFGKLIAGWSLIAWGVYVSLLVFVNIDQMLNLAFGFLVGFQVLSALGLVVMMVDQVRIKAEESENQVRKLEGLLPICCHCKKIRDENNEWHVLEKYIKDHSTADFSHGICPECLQKYYPNL